MERITTSLDKLAQAAKKANISSKKLNEATPNYSLPNGIVTFSEVEVVTFEDKPNMNHIALKAQDSNGLDYFISVGRLQFSGIAATETKEATIENIKQSDSGVYYLPGIRVNNWLQNNQIEACKQLIGCTFEVENIDMFALKYAEKGYKEAPKTTELVIKQVPKLTPVKVATA